MDGLLKQIGGLEQYVYLAPVHGARNATGQAGRHEGRFLNSLQHLHQQVNIAAFLVVMHARAKQSDLNALAKHVLRCAFDGVDLGGSQAHGDFKVGTRLRGHDKKAACNFIATAVLRCKKQHFPNISTRLVWIKFTGKPARAQARLLRLPDGGDHAGAKVGLALLLERADDGAADHAAVASDVDFVFLAHGII